MLEHMSVTMARIREIESRFVSNSTQGAVSIAPHLTSLPPSQPDKAKAFFPDYLIEEAHKLNGTQTAENTDFDGIIERVSAKYGVDASLVRAVIKAESGFNPSAVSSKGARGLMQLIPSTASAMGVSDPFDPEQNIEGGVKYLKQQIDRFGDIKLALAAYNAGPGAVAKYGGVPPYRETTDYVNKVLSYQKR